MKHSVPAAPQPSFGDALSSASRVESEPQSAPRLDGAFLNRFYRVALLFGVIVACGVLVATRSMLQASSLLVGVAVGVLLLKSQEFFVRLAVRPPSQGTANPQNLKYIAAMVFVLPLKIAVVGGGLFLLWRAQAINIWAFWAGFVLVQVVLLARLALYLTQAKKTS